ncbi:PE-PGRS family protein [Streptomyces canus]|uniref:PE-PGRS family protein n=1 Tax=Streptomyces canus TaxID=58343 RepID=UPI0033C7122E
MSGGDELVELLGRAGLEVVGERRVEEVPPPPVVWRHVIGSETEPTVEVADDRPDPVAELNAQWHRLASDAGILGGDGVFLIDFSGNTDRSWVRVRLTDGWDLAGVLGPRPGQPEFLTLSLDGDTMVGATTEEYAVWLVAVDRLRERHEEAARAAGAETPEERAAAWETLFRGPQARGQLLDAWANGLSLNPATPKELRSKLWERSHYAMYSALPTEQVDAALAHPDWKTRSRAAEVQPNITPEQWSRVLLGEQNARQRWVLTLLAAERRAEVPEDTCRTLAADPSARVRSEAAGLKGLPASVLVALSADPDGGVRYAACKSAWPHLDTSARHRLLNDSEDKVRAEALLLHHQDHPMPHSVYEAEGVGTRALETCLLERGLAEQLARNGQPGERGSLALNPRLDPDLVALLGEDRDAGVRFVVSCRADLTEEQRDGILYDFDPGVHYFPLDWVVALHDDRDAMRRLAASSHPLVRRSVARARHLPPDAVAHLADDEDRVVQLFLAESCDDAPADMLMRCGSGGTAASPVPTGRSATPTSPATTSCATPTTRTRACADWPSTTRRPPPSWSNGSAGTAVRRSAAGPSPTRGSLRRPRHDCWRTRTNTSAARPRATPTCRPVSSSGCCGREPAPRRPPPGTRPCRWRSCGAWSNGSAPPPQQPTDPDIADLRA